MINSLEMKGLDLSRRYFLEAGLPLLQNRYPELVQRVAAGLVAGGFDSGCGSEVAGFDDAISRDHNWGPRFFLFLSEQDKERYGPKVQVGLDRNLPEEFRGFRLSATTLPKHKAYVVTPAETLKAVLGLDTPPQTDVEWITLPEVALFEYTSGEIFYEPTPLISPLRYEFTYFPDEVWYKRLSHAFFMMHLAGNAKRMAMRGDPVATRIYLDWFLQIVMRAAFLVRRRYAPYCKWLFQAFTQLPDIPAELVESIQNLSFNLNLDTVEQQMVAVFDKIAMMTNQSGIIEPVPLRKESPFVWIDFNCYGFMYAFHEMLRGPLKEKSPYDGPLDMTVANGKLNHPTLMTAWETDNMKHGGSQSTSGESSASQNRLSAVSLSKRETPQRSVLP